MKTNDQLDTEPHPEDRARLLGRQGMARRARCPAPPGSTEAEYRQLVAIVNASRDAIWSWDRDGTITAWNAEAERLFQYTADEIVGQSIFTLVPPERHEIAREALTDLRKGDWFGQYETERVAKDGTRVAVELTVSPIRDDYGAPGGAATICRDITERKRSEHLRALLTGELKHRVKNTLAIVQAIANLTFSGIPEAAEGLETFRGRLGALGAAHDLLIRKNWEAAPLDQLVGDVLDALGAGERVTREGSAVTLEAGPAVTVSMALHELATNALKYGALSVPQGSVAITWTVPDDAAPALRLVWEERGGPPVSPPEHHGFGLRLLERMLWQQKGGVSLDFRPEGLVCVTTVPVAGERDTPPPPGAAI